MPKFGILFRLDNPDKTCLFSSWPNDSTRQEDIYSMCAWAWLGLAWSETLQVESVWEQGHGYSKVGR